MKKIIISMILAVSLMAFIGCNNGNKADDDQPVTPAELLKNIPVRPDDYTNMLRSATVNNSRTASNEITETQTQTEIILLVLKTCISETSGLEFGKNKTIGVIGEFSENARNKFLEIYPAAYVDGLFESFATRDFGSTYVNMENDKVTIFWYMPGWSPQEGTNFPACYLYIDGTYKNDRYEEIKIYGENYCYCYDSADNFVKAVPIYEKTYISDNKVISLSFNLTEDDITKNKVSKLEVTSNSASKGKALYSSDLPTQADIDGYHQKIQNWYSTIN